MLEVTSINCGIVIDHINCGNGQKIFEKLNLGNVDFPVVLLMNVPSKKLGKKDIIKIENKIDLNLDMLGLIDSDITINIIENGNISKKMNVDIPKKVSGLFKCENPRCISNSDIYATPTFTLVNKNKNKIKYQCNYCDDFTYFNQR
ncbi:aspartate carbamoyltransferase regulatory subunit [Thermohalobacter berrensis]|uniref:Aspartate carbamoyltransferase regulatory subunit n=1 Tax=Thermohalobacter berrensis TaxID=99594 RepID=A0A419TA32_9FIRM|nr:aspartate carbamoyltransferase regulatory subunit [Thermohalobacter berrensis]RKD34340.1 aspartate carbamoyltransferase regulatory subunit [Thermohalobacter berrensis]